MGTDMLESDRIMFEIYQEGSYDRRYRVVYFTELDDDNKDKEIDRALAGEHFYDGFIRSDCSDEAKQIIEGMIERLNNGEDVDSSELDRALMTYTP